MTQVKTPLNDGLEKQIYTNNLEFIHFRLLEVLSLNETVSNEVFLSRICCHYVPQTLDLPTDPCPVLPG